MPRPATSQCQRRCKRRCQKTRRTAASACTKEPQVTKIDEYLGSAKIPVFVYTTYHKGQKAEEPGA